MLWNAELHIDKYMSSQYVFQKVDNRIMISSREQRKTKIYEI